MGLLLSASVALGGLTTRPVYPGDFPDPDVVAIPSGYAAFATGSSGTNLQVMTSPDLATWSTPVDPLPVLPSWAEVGRTWAPGVVKLGGRWVMYFTAHRAGTSVQCIGVAVASDPLGPYSSRPTRPLICQPPGSIDPSPFVDARGRPFLVWKSDDNAQGRPSSLWAQPLASDGLSLLGGPSRLLTAVWPWQAGVIEGPTMVRDGPFELLFYGANRWDSSTSGIGYAVCLSPVGPCLNQSVLGPWLGTSRRVVGPQGPSVFVGPSGQLHLAYAAWTGAVGYPNGRRSLWIDRLQD